MKKLALLFGALFIANFGKAQFAEVDSSEFAKFRNDVEKVEPKVSFPNFLIYNELEFRHVRDSIHRTGLSYRLISFDSLGVIQKSDIFESYIPRYASKNRECQFSLVDPEGKILKMIYLDPKLNPEF